MIQADYSVELADKLDVKSARAIYYADVINATNHENAAGYALELAQPAERARQALTWASPWG